MIESMKGMETNGDVDRDNQNRSPASGEEDEEIISNNDMKIENEKRGSVTAKLNRNTADLRRISGRSKVLEAMDSTQGDSLDSELDLDGDDDDDGSDLDSEDELELVNLTKGSATKKQGTKPDGGLMSDDDF